MSEQLSTLFSNLELLRDRYPGLHRRLDKAVVGSVLENLFRGEDGKFSYLVEDEKQHKILVKESAHALDTSGKRMVILLGIGLGYTLFEVFRQLEDNQYLIAVETRPDLLCKSMYVHDWRDLLSSDKVKLFLGFDRHEIARLTGTLATVNNQDEYVVLDNKVLVTIDQQQYNWWNVYFYLISGLSYDGIRVINSVMSNFNLWDPDNLFLNLPNEFLGKNVTDLKAEEIFGRFHILAKALAPGMRTMRLKKFPIIKDTDCECVGGRVSVVVLCWNNSVYTRKCLESLLEKTDYPDLKVIAVDNGSTDDTRDLLVSMALQDKRIHPVLCDQNLGIPMGRQVGYRVSDGEFILFMDNDTEIEREDFLKIMVKTIQSHPNIGATGAFPIAYTNHYDNSFIQCVHIPKLIVPVAWCSTYCLLVRRAALEDMGGIDAEDFEAYGAEDVYLGYKLRDYGWMTTSTPEMVGVTHHIQHREDHYDYDWEVTGKKNREFFFREFGPRRRLLNAALDNRIEAGLWDNRTQKFI
jgi:GT2 family glycosyltransferase